MVIAVLRSSTHKVPGKCNETADGIGASPVVLFIATYHPWGHMWVFFTSFIRNVRHQVKCLSGYFVSQVLQGTLKTIQDMLVFH